MDKETGKRLISIIIPVYNEEDGIKALLDNLKSYKNKCEILFVDGGSKDNTLNIIAKEFNAVASPLKGRANQMNYGALKSSGNVLFFLHADSLLPENALREIETVMNKGYKAGCFKVRFISGSLLMSVCGFMSNLRVRLRNIAFGDQGIFIDRDYFFHLGCFQPIPIMEDYRLSMDIKKDGQKICMANAGILTSERRFVKYGRVKTMRLMQKLQRLYRKGSDINYISELYNNRL